MGVMGATPNDIDPLISPCVGVCTLDPNGGNCLGCGRTGDEIAEWGLADAARREAIWRALPGRMATLGGTLLRLPWNARQTLDFVEDSLRASRGAWVLGVHGAVGEFVRDPDEPLSVDRAERAIEATTPRAALRLGLDAMTRALAVGDPPDLDRPARVVLARADGGGGHAAPAALTALGPDRRAIRPEAREAQLFDIGLGRAAARFCIRTADPELAGRLTAAEGLPWPDYMVDLSPAVVAAGPTRVIETALGRVEIDAPIPPPGGASPEGPHTHLLPDLLASGRDAPPEFELPPGWVPGAIFYRGEG